MVIPGGSLFSQGELSPFREVKRSQMVDALQRALQEGAWLFHMYLSTYNIIHQLVTQQQVSSLTCRTFGRVCNLSQICTPDWPSQLDVGWSVHRHPVTTDVLLNDLYTSHWLYLCRVLQVPDWLIVKISIGDIEEEDLVVQNSLHSMHR